jgi:hypothetical protein
MIRFDLRNDSRGKSEARRRGQEGEAGWRADWRWLVVGGCWSGSNLMFRPTTQGVGKVQARETPMGRKWEGRHKDATGSPVFGVGVWSRCRLPHDKMDFMPLPATCQKLPSHGSLA